MIPRCWITYNVNKLTHITYLVIFLVTIIKEKTRFYRFFLTHQFMHPSSPRCHHFWNKWSWGLCVILIWWITYHVNKLIYTTYLCMYSVTIIKKNSNLSMFSWLPSYAPRRETFELHGHEASAWYKYDELLVIWTNRSI